MRSSSGQLASGRTADYAGGPRGREVSAARVGAAVLFLAGCGEVQAPVVAAHEAAWGYSKPHSPMSEKPALRQTALVADVDLLAGLWAAQVLFQLRGVDPV